MVKSIRLVIAIAVAVAALIMASFYTGNFLNKSLLPSVGRISGLSAIGLGISAFVLAIKLKSIVVAGLLIAAGAIIMVPPVTAISEVGTIIFPGPILGVIAYSPILGLGISKIMTSTMRNRTVNAITK